MNLKTNLLGLVLNLVLALVFAAGASITEAADGGLRFSTFLFVHTSIVGLISVLPAFMTHSNIPIYGNSGIPGTSPAEPPPPPNPPLPPPPMGNLP